MKKLLTLSLVALVSVVGFTACGQKGEDISIVIEDVTEVETEAEEETQAEAETEAEEETQAEAETDEIIVIEPVTEEVTEEKKDNRKDSISDNTNFKPITDEILKINDNFAKLAQAGGSEGDAKAEFTVLQEELYAFITEKAEEIQACDDGKINIGQDDVSDMVKEAEKLNDKIRELNKKYDLGAKLEK